MTLFSIHRVAAVEVMNGTMPYTGGYVTTLRVVTEDDQVTEITLFAANEIKLDHETDT